MVQWPGTPPVDVSRISDVELGDDYTVSSLKMDSHTGTHIDAPRHFIRGGKTLDQMPLDATVGPARILEIGDPVSIKAAELRAQGVGRGQRLLFKTRNSRRCWNSDSFTEEYVHLTLESAEYLAGLGVRCVGIDYLSIAGFKENLTKTHLALLEAGIWIIEGLNLSGVEPGDCELVCLPLKIPDSDGSPARAIVRPR
jgi:arylformamidase